MFSLRGRSAATPLARNPKILAQNLALASNSFALRSAAFAREVGWIARPAGEVIAMLLLSLAVNSLRRSPDDAWFCFSLPLVGWLNRARLVWFGVALVFARCLALPSAGDA